MKVGVLGGGQLGQMLALAGIPLGLRFRFLDPADESPAGQVAERIIGSFDDAECLDRFADGLDVVTYEFENVPTASARRLAQRVPVYPPPAALEVSQDRLAEKQLFDRLNIPTTQYFAVDARADLEQAVGRLGYPARPQNAPLRLRRQRADGVAAHGRRRTGLATVRRPEPLAGRVHRLRGGIVPVGGARPRRRRRLLSARGKSSQTGHSPLVAGAGAATTADLQRTANDYALRVLNTSGICRRVGRRVLSARRPFDRQRNGAARPQFRPLDHRGARRPVSSRTICAPSSAGRSARRRQAFTARCSI